MGPTIRRARRGGAVPTLIAVVALAVVGCTSEPDVAIDGDPAAAVARAAGDATGTVRFRVDVRTSLDVFVAVQTAEGIVEPDGDSRVTLSTTMDVVGDGSEDGAVPNLPPSLEALAGSREVIAVDGALYTRWEEGGGPRQADLPPGIEWVATQAGEDGAADVGGYLAARRVLDTLAEVTEVVEDRGSTTVDEEPVRWLRVEAPAGDGGASFIPPGTVLDVALDREGRVRRVAFETSEDGLRTRVIVDYEAYDVDEVVTPPPAEATIDLAELDDPDGSAP